MSGEYDEFYQGDVVILTITFADPTNPGNTPTDPDAATTTILPGYDPADAIILNLGALTKISTGVYQYRYATAGLDTTAGKIEHGVQTRATGSTLAGTSEPYFFTVLPPKVPGLT